MPGSPYFQSKEVTRVQCLEAASRVVAGATGWRLTQKEMAAAVIQMADLFYEYAENRKMPDG